MRIYIVFFIIAIPQFIFAQEYQPVACPLGQEQTILNLPKPGAGKLSNAENDIRAFVRDSLQSVVNRKFISHSQRYFSIKKVPDAAIYRIDYHPYDAYTAIKGRDTARVLTLYLFLHAIAHTDLHHARAEGTEEAAADEKTGEYLAKLGIRWPDIENMLARHIKDGLQRKSHLLKGYQKVNPPPIAKFTYKCRNTQTGAAECTEPCRVDFKSESTNVNSSTKYFWNGVELGTKIMFSDTLLKEGSYTMTLEVVNSDGQRNTSTTQTIQINKASLKESVGQYVQPAPPNDSANSYITLAQKPVAAFRIEKRGCPAPCKITITNESSNINTPHAKIKWYINNRPAGLGANKIFTHKITSGGEYQIRLEIDNGNGETDTASETVKINDKKIFSFELQPYISLPIGLYKDVNIFPSWRGDWNPEAGMANFGYGGEMAIGLNVLKFMSLRLQGGYVHNDYNTTALFFQLEDYELQTGQSLQEKFIESTGYRKAYYGASISIEPIPVESTFYLSLEPAYGQIIAPWENSTSVYYTKDDGQRWQTRLVYGLPENGASSYWSGKIQMGVRWGEEDGQRPNLISLSGSFFYSNFATGVQSHSLGDNSQPLVITQSRIQAFHVGIGYRRWF